jgi:hypothetical protein
MIENNNKKCKFNETNLYIVGPLLNPMRFNEFEVRFISLLNNIGGGFLLVN